MEVNQARAVVIGATIAFMIIIGVLTGTMMGDKQGIKSFNDDSYTSFIKGYSQLKGYQYVVSTSYTNEYDENFDCILYNDDYYDDHLINDKLDKLQNKYSINETIEIYVDENSQYCKPLTNREYDFTVSIIFIWVFSVLCFICILTLCFSCTQSY